MVKKKIEKFVEILFYTFPLSFILGNLFLSLHLVFFIIVSLILIKKESLPLRFENLYWLLILFFLYFFLLTTVQFQTLGLLNNAIHDWSLESNPLFKSFVLVRFLILIFVIDTLYFNNKLDFTKLFLFSLICTSFVSLDIILQHITGFDLFGFKSLGARNSGPFGDEVIAGSFLQKFSFLSIFYVYGVLKNKNFVNPILILIITLHASAILLAGNRMPMLLFLLGCFLIIVFLKKIRTAMTFGLIIFFSIASVIIINNKDFEKRYVGQILYNFNAGKLALDVEKPKTTDEGLLQGEKYYDSLPWATNFLRTTGHSRIYKTAIKMWKEQPLFGFGLKSFRIKCWDILKKWEGSSWVATFSCANHPHNYYLELLSEGGVIGVSLMIIFFIILLSKSIYHLIKQKRIEYAEKYLLIPVMIIFFLEIWPIRSSGSFFTTWNATLFWLNAAILLALNNKKVA